MKILIFTASTGGGHKRAAAAFKDSVQRIAPDTEILIVDGLALTGNLYNNFICEGYTILAKKAPDFYGLIYKKSDKKSILNNFCNTVNKSKGDRLMPAIEKFEPNAIISCHAFITTMLGNLRKKKILTVPVFALITDFATHYTYIAEGIDHYIVSSQEMLNILTNKYKISKDSVHPYGIPVFDKFSQPANKQDLRKKLDLSEKLPTVLFMAGSFGVNEVLKFYESVATREPHLQFIVITGKNPKLYHKFEKIINSNTKLLMYVNNVNEYMHCSDIIITKPGGLTISESLQCHLPIAIYSAFPGQEAENAVYLVNKGAAIMLGKNPGYTISTLLKNKTALKNMSESCKKICPINPAQNIYNLICQVVNKERIGNTENEG